MPAVERAPYAAAAAQRHHVMQRGSADSNSTVLPYRTSGPRKSVGAAGTLSVLSLTCAAVPVLGIVIRNGSVFLDGLLLSFVGAALGIGAVISSVKASSVFALAIVALVVNCLIAAYCI